MPLDLSAVGRRSEVVSTSWTTDDVMLYAVSVGAGQDPLSELDVTTENTGGIDTVVLPTFAALVSQRVLRPSIGPFDPAMLVHAEQEFALAAPLPVQGRADLVAEVTEILDKGKGALVRTATTATDPDTGTVLFTARSAAFIRGEGGFGGDRGSSAGAVAPDREPDAVVEHTTRPEQALLYRLNGDRNPLHSDPAFARRGGFERPILHGMCTYGFAGRAVVAAACAGDPTRLRAMSGRFTAPVLPGDVLRTSVWTEGSQVFFRTARTDGVVVIERGAATVTPGATT